MSLSAQLTKTVSGCTFYDKILYTIVFIGASQLWRLKRLKVWKIFSFKYFSILNENTFTQKQSTKILLQWLKISHNRPFPRYGWLNVKVACTYQSLAFNFHKICSREILRNEWLNDNSFISIFHEYIRYWNMLPVDVKVASSINDFKNKLEHYEQDNISRGNINTGYWELSQETFRRL